jgi:hypothetical protein
MFTKQERMIQQDEKNDTFIRVFIISRRFKSNRGFIFNNISKAQQQKLKEYIAEKLHSKVPGIPFKVSSTTLDQYMKRFPDHVENTRRQFPYAIAHAPNGAVYAIKIDALSSIKRKPRQSLNQGSQVRKQKTSSRTTRIESNGFTDAVRQISLSTHIDTQAIEQAIQEQNKLVSLSRNTLIASSAPDDGSYYLFFYTTKKKPTTVPFDVPNTNRFKFLPVAVSDVSEAEYISDVFNIPLSKSKKLHKHVIKVQKKKFVNRLLDDKKAPQRAVKQKSSSSNKGTDSILVIENNVTAPINHQILRDMFDTIMLYYVDEFVDLDNRENFIEKKMDKTTLWVTFLGANQNMNNNVSRALLEMKSPDVQQETVRIKLDSSDNSLFHPDFIFKHFPMLRTLNSTRFAPHAFVLRNGRLELLWTPHKIIPFA